MGWLLSLLLPLFERMGVSLVEIFLKRLEKTYPGISPIFQDIIDFIDQNPQSISKLAQQIKTLT